MQISEFKSLVEQGYKKIPLIKQVLADLDTPVSSFLKLADLPYSYLLESVDGGEKWGRYSIIGLEAKTVIKVFGNKITLLNHGEIVKEQESENPLNWIENYQAGLKVAPIKDLDIFTGGLVGYFGYETIKYIEPRLAESSNPDRLNTPDILLMQSEELLVFDNLKGSISIVVHADSAADAAFDKAQARLDAISHKLRQPLGISSNQEVSQETAEADFASEFPKQDFIAAVRKIKDYIVEGDVMQVVLSQRMSHKFSTKPVDLYRALRNLNPSPYMFYLNLDDFVVVGSSPEILVKLEDNTVTVRPIAGTRKRGKNQKEDLALEHDLLADPKELAEHLMLIDLGRNDVGRISKIGSVALTEKMAIERYSHVMHIVSNVIGKLETGKSVLDVLAATFPAGTVSGAPKIRAMEIIEELEPTKRGVYAGAVGYLSWNNNLDTAIAIRTAIIKDETLYIQAGAGIVHDSIPEKEWEETLNKGQAILKAAAMVQSDFSE